MGVFKRGNKLWITFKDTDGTWRNVTSGFSVGQEDLAQARYEVLVAQVSGEVAGVRTKNPAAVTVRTFADEWIPQRRELDLDWKNDESRLRHHVLPIIGDMPIANVRARHLVDLFHRIRTTARDGADAPASQRTIYNIYSVVAAMFRDAELKGVIERAPAKLTERQLGTKTDADPMWRASAVFTRDEAQAMISDERIPQDRRVYYAFGLLAGLRPGEIAALRWSHYDAAIEPLGKLTIAFAHNTRKNRTKTTKTEAVRIVPVHPTLAAMLAEWKLSGWAEMVGRQPTPDDLLLPLPPIAAARRRSREGDAIRTGDYAGKRWREVDLVMLGWRSRELYATKSTCITLAIEDGANRDILRDRITHTKAKRDAFSGYDRGPHWIDTCAELAKLKIARVAGEVLAQNAVAIVGAPYDPLTATATSEDNREKQWRRRESNPVPTARHDTARPDFRALAAVDSAPNDAAPRSAVMSPLQVALAAISDAWRIDERETRREVMRLLAELEDAP